MERYGAPHNFSNPEIYDKTRQTRKIRHWGPEMLSIIDLDIESKREYIISLTNGKVLTRKEVWNLMAQKYTGAKIMSFAFFTHWVKEIGDMFRVEPRRRTSQSELDLANFVKSCTDSRVCQTVHPEFMRPKSGGHRPLELDIFLPDRNLAIEFNGSFWHRGAGTVLKSRLAELHDVQLIHIWDFDWSDSDKHERIKKFIHSRLNDSPTEISLKELELVELDRNTAGEFYREFDLKSRYLMGEVNLGLTKGNNLICAMSFSASLRQISGWCITKFCVIPDTKVPGAVEYLFNYFRNIYNPEEIHGIHDIFTHTGNMYRKLGMFEDESLTKIKLSWMDRRGLIPYSELDEHTDKWKSCYELNRVWTLPCE